MSIKKVTRLSVFAGVVVFALAFSAGVSWATEPCKDKPTTTTTEKPKPTTTTVKPTTTTMAEKPKPQEVTTTTVKHQTSPQRSTTTTVDVATPEMIETSLVTEPLPDDSIQPVQLASSSTPTELAQTGAMTTRLAFLGAALSGIGWVILLWRNRLAG